MTKIKKFVNKKNIIIILLLIACLTTGISFCYSYLTTKGSYQSSNDIKIIGFGSTVNSSFEKNQTIDLASTITNNKTLAPGAEGKFKIDVGLGYVDLNTYYKLSYDRTNIPDNLHFYVDENYTSELTIFEGVQYTGDQYNPVAEHYIYWKWDYVDSEEANANDNLYMNKKITVPFKVYIVQKVENRTILTYGYERQTGTLLTIGKSGSYNLRLNFENLGPTNYKIYFDTTDVSNRVHFYSDSSRTHEITSISGYYDGTNNEITRTVYWKTINSTNVSGVVYYVVVFD